MFLSSGTGIPIVFFIPSTSMLDYPVNGFVEYSAAKAAAGQVAQHMELFDRKLALLKSRLHRVATDQTISLTGEPAKRAEHILLPLLNSAQEKRLTLKNG